MKIGTAESKPGEVSKGYIDMVSFPTGGMERAPVMLATGEDGNDSPTLWLTANLHGNEVTGIPVVHQTVTKHLAERMNGTVVGVITLNPSGLRSADRRSHYDTRDPNRLFPDFNQGDDVYRTTQELINNRVFKLIENNADTVIDLHCSNLGSVPFTILDRVFRGNENVDDTEQLIAKQKKYVDSFGFTPVIGPEPKRMMELDLHRTLTASVLNNIGIPAFTAELGSDYIVEKNVVSAAVKGIKNVMREMGMLDGEIQDVGGITKMPHDFTARRTSIESPVSGLLDTATEPGELVREGEPVCRICDSFGETKHVVEAHRDGWVTSFRMGIGVEEGSRVCYYAEKTTEDDMLEILNEDVTGE
ncbi:MAG: succinylglutamate desuccinylase/aspartoacylase family protein [Halobacteria archaeon]